MQIDCRLNQTPHGKCSNNQRHRPDIERRVTDLSFDHIDWINGEAVVSDTKVDIVRRIVHRPVVIDRYD